MVDKYKNERGLKNFWCSCGKRNLWTNDYKGQHSNQHLFDIYSLCHAQFGSIQYLALNKIGYKYNLLLHLIWEIIENSPEGIKLMRLTKLSPNYCGDSIANSLGDLLSFSVGYLSIESASKKNRILIILMLELVPYLLTKQNTFLLVKDLIQSCLPTANDIELIEERKYKFV